MSQIVCPKLRNRTAHELVVHALKGEICESGYMKCNIKAEKLFIAFSNKNSENLFNKNKPEILNKMRIYYADHIAEFKKNMVIFREVETICEMVLPRDKQELAGIYEEKSQGEFKNKINKKIHRSVYNIFEDIRFNIKKNIDNGSSIYIKQKKSEP